jgi:DNA-binding NarL/FixJ family response regulator
MADPLSRKWASSTKTTGGHPWVSPTDDNDAFLQAASDLLEPEGVTVAGAASGIAAALRKARALRPDVGFCDESGLDLARFLTSGGRDDTP